MADAKEIQPNTMDSAIASLSVKRMKISDRAVVSTWYDLLFLCFPVWIPIVFYTLFLKFPEQIGTVFLVGLLLLGETHFGATWLFFADPNNKNYMNRKPVALLVIPAFIIAVTILVFFLISPGAAIVMASAASAFHVTRQSIGINKMFGIKNNRMVAFSNYAIYAFSAWFIGIGFLRFFVDFIPVGQYLEAVALGSGISIALALLFLFTRKESSDLSLMFHLSTITGILIYAPYSFVPRPEYAMVMGVGMHWMQYVALVMPIYLRKSKLDVSIRQAPLSCLLMKSGTLLGVFLLIYAVIMVLLRQNGVGFNTFQFSSLIIIPLTLQMLHFYYDAFIWRFSDPHIRKEVGTYVFAVSPP